MQQPLYCAGAGRIRTGRPSADGKKQSCGLFFRPRLANPPAPTKKLWQRYCRSFFSLLYRTKPEKAMTDFQSAFYKDVQLLPGGWIFLLPTFSAAFRMLRQYRIILSADTASEVPQPPERCLSRQAGIVRCCLKTIKELFRRCRADFCPALAFLLKIDG